MEIEHRGGSLDDTGVALIVSQPRLHRRMMTQSLTCRWLAGAALLALPFSYDGARPKPPQARPLPRLTRAPEAEHPSRGWSIRGRRNTQRLLTPLSRGPGPCQTARLHAGPALPVVSWPRVIRHFERECAANTGHVVCLTSMSSGGSGMPTGPLGHDEDASPLRRR